MGRILGFFSSLQSWVYWYIVISLTQGKSLFNYWESGSTWMINGFTFLPSKGLNKFTKSSNKQVSFVHYFLTRPIPYNFAKVPIWMYHLNQIYRTSYFQWKSQLYYVISYRSFLSNYRSDTVLVDKKSGKRKFYSH